MQNTHVVGYLLQHVATQMAKQSDQVLQEQLGIGFSQFKILRTLQTCPHVKQRVVASNLGQTEASISRQVKLMIEQGLLKVTISSANHREHITLVTAKGERLTDAAIAVLAKYHAPTFDVLSDKQHEQLTGILERLHNEVCPGGHLDPTTARTI
ncbi:MAG: MarR family winged helix-turn-helix transcriptional regulator [Candidatus Saccharimonadales bacterium]